MQGGSRLPVVRSLVFDRLSFPFLPLPFWPILLAWANAVKRGNAPFNFCFSMT